MKRTLNELWQEFQEGNEEAFSRLYRNVIKDVYSYGMAVSPDPELVKDAIHDVFVRLLENKGEIKIQSSIDVYLYFSVRNKIIDELRKKKQKTGFENELLDDGKTMIKREVDKLIYHSDYDEKRFSIIKIALKSVSPSEKEAIYLRFTQGYSYKEISEILKIDIASSRTLVYRGLKKVKEQISGKNLLILFFSEKKIIQKK